MIHNIRWVVRYQDIGNHMFRKIKTLQYHNGHEWVDVEEVKE
jgi:hypothetical protein